MCGLHDRTLADRASSGSAWTEYTDDDLKAWRSLRTELIEQNGCDSKTIDRHKDRIIQMLAELSRESPLASTTPPTQALPLGVLGQTKTVSLLCGTKISPSFTKSNSGLQQPIDTTKTNISRSMMVADTGRVILERIYESDASGKEAEEVMSKYAVKLPTGSNSPQPYGNHECQTPRHKPRSTSFNTPRQSSAARHLRNSASDTALASILPKMSNEPGASILREPTRWKTFIPTIARSSKPSKSSSDPATQGLPKFEEDSLQFSLSSSLCETVFKVGSKVNVDCKGPRAEQFDTQSAADDSDQSQYSMQANASVTGNKHDGRRHQPSASLRHFETGSTELTHWERYPKLPHSSDIPRSSPSTPRAGFLPNFAHGRKPSRTATYHKAPRK